MAAKILGCLNSVSLRRKAWLPSVETVTSILRRERRSSIDFVPSLCYTLRPSIVPQNESQPSAIPLTFPFHSNSRTFEIKISTINLTFCVCRRKKTYTNQKKKFRRETVFCKRKNKHFLPISRCHYSRID